MKIAAPGKIILSGEHAVVYQKQALALAVDRYVYVTISSEARPGILFDFADLQHRSRISEALLKILKAQIKAKYQRFKRGDVSIRRVLKKPFELAQFAFSTVTDTFNLSIPHGIQIRIESTIPIGCGMGSSAATIVSVMYAISNYLQRPIEEDEFFKLALDAENLQHGASSGVDLRVALQGGCMYFNGQQRYQRELSTWPIKLVNTGAPQTTTGQCVAHAARFLQDQSLLNEFATVTATMDQSICEKNYALFLEMISANHYLLKRIGVVPAKVQQFIAEIEQMGGAAKTSGAGASAGDSGGMVIVSLPDDQTLKKRCESYGYEILDIAPASTGVHSVYN